MFKQLHLSKKSLTSVALLTVLLLLGFCPLRNCLTAWLSHNSHVTRTNGSHLLTADGCSLQSSVETPALQKHSPTPPLAIALFVLVLFETITFRPCNFAGFTVIVSAATAVPIYLRYRVWRI